MVQDVRVSTEVEITDCRLEGSSVLASGHLGGYEHIRIEVQVAWWGSGPVIVDLRLICAPNEADGITDGFMRSLRLPAIRRAVLSRLVTNGVVTANDVEGSAVSASQALAAQWNHAFAGLVEADLSAETDAGSYKWHDERLRAVAVEALRYQAVSKTSVRSHIATWLHENYADTPSKSSTARDVIGKARQRGFLALTKSGYRDLEPGRRLTHDDLRSIADSVRHDPTNGDDTSTSKRVRTTTRAGKATNTTKNDRTKKGGK